MKQIILFFMIIIFFGSVLVSCEWREEEEETIDPCTVASSCIPELSDWKLPFKPYNSDCTMCHTTCTPSASHIFCMDGDMWNATENRCLKCHANQHK